MLIYIYGNIFHIGGRSLSQNDGETWKNYQTQVAVYQEKFWQTHLKSKSELLSPHFIRALKLSGPFAMDCNTLLKYVFLHAKFFLTGRIKFDGLKVSLHIWNTPLISIHLLKVRLYPPAFVSAFYKGGHVLFCILISDMHRFSTRWQLGDLRMQEPLNCSPML